MKRDKRIEVVLAIWLIFSVCNIAFVLMPHNQQTTEKKTAKFIISSWDYPDEYGQGIEAIYIYENSTGAWLEVGLYDYTSATTIDWTAGVGIRLITVSTLNYTITGAASLEDGENYLQHSVTATSNNGTVMFSSQDFTLNFSEVGNEVYFYYYEIVLNFLPEDSTIYTVVLTCEIYYPEV